MIVISFLDFGFEDIERLKSAGIEYYYADNGGADPHAVTSHIYNAGIKSLPAQACKEATAIIIPSYHVNDELMKICPNLQWVHHPGAGINSGSELYTDWNLIKKYKMIITTSKIHEQAVSEMVLAYILILTKNMLKLYENKQNRIYYSEYFSLPIPLLREKTVLILGTGNIGTEIARKLKNSFYMKTIGINSSGREIEYFDEVYTLNQLDGLLQECDYLILAITLTDKTQNIINVNNLKRMKKTAFLINVSRGNLIVESDLIEALKNQTIAGAGLDVFSQEPLPADSPLWEIDNVIITPHISGNISNYNSKVLDKFLGNLDHFMKKEWNKMTSVANIKRY